MTSIKDVSLLVLFSICNFSALLEAVGCPCNDIALCKPIEDTARKEVFAFSYQNVPATRLKYDWTKVTTLAMDGYVNLDLMCLAHRNGARVVKTAKIPKENLPNITARAEWLKSQLKIIQDNFLDGINFDFEDVILQNETTYRDSYTMLVSETYSAFKGANQFYQVTVDVAWASSGIDLRYYDYVGLANASDFLFIMAYDEQSQIKGPCVAGPNSPLTNAELGKYLLCNAKDDTCYLKYRPFRGVNCSDAAGREIDYSKMKSYLQYSNGVKWNQIAQTPYFSFVVNNTEYQVQYDTPKSLRIKYALVKQYNLQGLGMWHADDVEYISNSTEKITEWTEMWGAIPNFSTSFSTSQAILSMKLYFALLFCSIQYSN